MTYIISAITDKSILMASDSRLNYHKEEIDSSTGARYQVITATADCINKTFLIRPHNIGIQFLGIGYFPDNGEKYPLIHFIPQITDRLLSTDSILIKFKKIYENLKKLTVIGDTGQYVNGVMTGYQKNIPYIATFNTFVDDFSVNAYEIGSYVESEVCNISRPKDRESVIKYINEKISSVSKERPHDVGGQIEILEIKPDNSSAWVQENPMTFNGPLSELLYKLENEPHTISGQILNPPIKQKLNL
jgi:hypothetical protein